MKNLVQLLRWTLRALVFLVLLAFALNNQQSSSLQFFFGAQWQAPQILIVLAAFACGLLAGVLAMAPRWWKWRRRAHTAQATAATTP
jgi:uncharacterized integral membrane protein